MEFITTTRPDILEALSCNKIEMKRKEMVTEFSRHRKVTTTTLFGYESVELFHLVRGLDKEITKNILSLRYGNEVTISIRFV